MSSISVAKHKQQATQSGGFFVVWLRHSSLRSSLCERSDAELGSHFASKAMGARSREPRAKIFAQRANTLVPRQSRSGIRFAFEPKTVGELAHQRLGEESSPKASTLVPKTDSRGRLSLQKILYIFRKICYNNLNK